MITLSSIEQSILKSNENYGFKFDAEKIGNFLTEILVENGGYPTDILSLKIPKDPLNEEDQEIKEE